MFLQLVSARMTEDELAKERRRRGHWMRLARLNANLNQNDVAERLGMSPTSGSTIVAWEKGRRDPKASQLTQLARIYGVKRSLFSDPPLTDEERLAEFALGAIEQAFDDSVVEGEEALDAGAGPDGLLRKLPA